MALEGTLSDFSLPDIFQLISLQRKSGILTLTSPEDVVSVFFKDGNILAADSQQDRIEERLGFYLVRAKLLSVEQLRRALQIQKETLQRLGNILLSYNFIQKEDLQKTLNLVITQKIYKLFRWRDGEYHFDPDAPVEFRDDYFIPIPAQGVLMEAVRMIDEWPMLEKEIPSFEIVFQKTGELKDIDKIDGKSLTGDDLFDDDSDFSGIIDEDREKMELDDEQERIFRFVDGRRTVKDIILDAQMTDFDVCQALVTLQEKGLIDRTDEFKVDRRAEWVKSTTRTDKIFEMGKILKPIIFIAVLVSLVMMNYNSLNIIVPFPESENKLIREKKHVVSINKIARLSRAVEQYTYIRKGYPNSLLDLVETGLVDESSISDPWGRPYELILSEDEKFIIKGLDATGKENPEFKIERKIPNF